MKELNLFISNFKRFFVFLAKVFVIALIIGLLMNWAFEKLIVSKSKISGSYKVSRIINDFYPKEIPIFGSSRAQSSIVPSILGENYFNYGIDGIGSKIWLKFLEEELKKDKNSPIIINFDLKGFTQDYGDLANYIPEYSRTNSWVNSELESFRRIPLIKYYGKFELYIKFFLNERINLTKISDRGGSFEKNAHTQERFSQLVARRAESRTKFLEDTRSLELLKYMIQSTNRKIFFVVAPYHESYFINFVNPEQYKACLRELSFYENVSVLDFSHLALPDSLFINTTHLNYEGATFFTNQLLPFLKDERGK